MLLMLLGVALRVAILASPLGEIEADESVVGLMALHILAGEWPVFYWGQPYLGGLEAYLAAALFTLVGPSNLALKLVPTVAYLAFALLVFLGTRRDFGERTALLSLLYLAVPPSFLALWSVKARGGYVELLALGQGLLFLAPWVPRARGRLAWRLFAAGLLSGLVLWTHVLGLVYVVPTALYFAIRLGRRLLGFPLLAGLVGVMIGLAPAIAYNLEHDRETITALTGGGFSLQVFQVNMTSLLKVGIPVMVGLGQATTSPSLHAVDWPARPASWPWVPPVVLALIYLGLLPSLWVLIEPPARRMFERNPTALLGLGVIAATPAMASLGRFGELVAEPRYALPLYSTVPLFAAAIIWLAARRAALAAAAAALIFTVNVWSLITVDPRLNLPTSAAGSTEANRAELISALEGRGLTELYTDYWLAYPLIFESDERISASVTSGGFNRFSAFAHLVAVSPHPAYVFIRGSREQAEFEQRLRAVGSRSARFGVSIYDVYLDVDLPPFP